MSFKLIETGCGLNPSTVYFSVSSDVYLLASDYKSVAELRLAQELRSYRSFCKRHKDELVGEVLATRSNLKMFVSDQRVHTLDFLNQTAFYLDQVIFDDPLFGFWHPKSKHQRVWSKFN